LRERRDPGHWPRLHTLSQLGAALAGQNKFAEAEPLLVQGYEGLKVREAMIPAPAKKSLTDAGGRLIALYDAWGKKDKAAEWRVRLGLADLPADVFTRP
jgi:hypothetical protein